VRSDCVEAQYSSPGNPETSGISVLPVVFHLAITVLELVVKVVCASALFPQALDTHKKRVFQAGRGLAALKGRLPRNHTAHTKRTRTRGF